MAGMKTIRESRGRDSDAGILRATGGKNKEKRRKDAESGERLKSWWKMGRSNEIAESIHKLLCENCHGACPTRRPLPCRSQPQHEGGLYADLAAHKPPVYCRDVTLPSSIVWLGSSCRSTPPSPAVAEQAEGAQAD